MASKDEIQGYLGELKILDKHIKELQSQIETLDEQSVELAYIQQSIDDLKKAERGSTVLVPLSNGIFAKATLEESDKLLVNVGSNIVVGKTYDQTKDMMAAQTKDLQEMRGTLERSIHKLVAKVMEIDQRISE
jgi:prefoldin alpha subunit